MGGIDVRHGWAARMEGLAMQRDIGAARLARGHRLQPEAYSSAAGRQAGSGARPSHARLCRPRPHMRHPPEGANCATSSSRLTFILSAGGRQRLLRRQHRQPAACPSVALLGTTRVQIWSTRSAHRRARRPCRRLWARPLAPVFRPATAVMMEAQASGVVRQMRPNRAAAVSRLGRNSYSPSRLNTWQGEAEGGGIGILLSQAASETAAACATSGRTHARRQRAPHGAGPPHQAPQCHPPARHAPGRRPWQPALGAGRSVCGACAPQAPAWQQS